MSYTMRHVILGVVLPFASLGCVSRNTNSDCDGGTITDPTNLITNSSFESAGNPSMDGWVVIQGPLAPFLLADAPDGGGCYSLAFAPGQPPSGGVVWTSIPGIQSGDVLRLSASVRVRKYGWASIGLTTELPPNQKHGAWVASGDTAWATVVVVDTVSLEVGDTVYVVLAGPSCELCIGTDGTGQFDLISLTREKHDSWK